ncbi:hypothetical protein IMCC9480_1699 [Oxalobacteraceae bacterium IMCC9480]|nr:hypothetical protein IMCC9480_1699 [Oxalobacteraceae bacterium IMCC9480]
MADQLDAIHSGHLQVNEANIDGLRLILQQGQSRRAIAQIDDVSGS